MFKVFGGADDTPGLVHHHVAGFVVLDDLLVEDDMTELMNALLNIAGHTAVYQNTALGKYGSNRLALNTELLAHKAIKACACGLHDYFIIRGNCWILVFKKRRFTGFLCF